MIDVLLVLLVWTPFLVLGAVLWTFFAAIRYTSCVLRKRRGEQVKDVPYDYELIAHAIWRERGFAAWHAAWEQEQEESR